MFRFCCGGHSRRARRHILLALIFWSLSATFIGVLRCPRAQAPAESAFSFEEVVARAREEASRPFANPEDSVPDFLLRLTYDQWRDIRFNEEATLWREKKLPFEVQFFHPGLFYNRLVTISTIGPEGVIKVPFSSAYFDYGANLFTEKIPEDFGFAGFRLLYSLNGNDHLDEVAAFLGASYFRAVGQDQVYGLSARGLAIDTGLDTGEEFPYFKEFWIQEPGMEDRELIVYALLDSRRITGAYRFAIRPGGKTDMLVEAVLFRREEIKKLGVAPLTSMFFYGENANQRPVDDFRPEVHDSDGLLIKNSREVLWRPIVNPQHLFINSFQVGDLGGFGVWQRDTDFDHYQDPEARYDLRPSTMVVPVGDWSPGHVELVQIPTESETNDNIVAYWVPDKLPPKEDPLVFSYVLSWFSPTGKSAELGQVIATRTASKKNDNSRQVIIDFKGGRLDQLPAQLPSESPLTAVISVGNGGEIVDHQLFRVKPAGSWRLAFRVRRNGGGALALPILRPPLEVRAHLTQGEVTLTETWSCAIWP